LHKPASIFPLIRRTMHWSLADMLTRGHSWTLLRSTVGSIFSLLNQFTGQALTLCKSSVNDIHGLFVNGTLDWRFAVLIMNLKQIYTKEDQAYDHVSAWRDYTARLLPIAMIRVDGLLERLFMWCITALEDVDTWESFAVFEELPCAKSSELDAANVREFESRRIFCYFSYCFQNKPLVESERTARVHEELVGCLKDLEERFCTSRAEALSTIAIMLVQSLNNSEACCLTDLRRQLLRQAHRIHFAPAPLGIFVEAGWKGSRFSAIFFETLVSKHCSQSHYSKSTYRELSDSHVRDFLEDHLTVEVSLQAFVYNPVPDLRPIQDRGPHHPPSLMGMIMR
jgi:hypothetical protein